MNHARLVAALSLCALSLSACASPTPQPTAPAAASPSATPESSGRPAQVFDGDCDALATEDEVSAILGREVALSNADESQLSAWVYEQAGGIDCEWAATGLSLTAIVLTAGAADFVDDSGCDVLMEVPGYICAFSASVSGLRLAGMVTLGGDVPAQMAAGQAFADLFSTRAPSASVPIAVAPEPTAWAPLSDCAQYAGAFEWEDSGFYDAAIPSSYRALRGGALGQCASPVDDAYGTADVSVLGGARWMEPQISSQPGVEKTQVDGLEAVYVGPVLSTGYIYIDVFDGVNWLQAFVIDADAAMPAIVDLVTQLNKP